MLRSQFRYIDRETIEDSIQYARLEYWEQNIMENVPGEIEAFNWFMKVAKYYLFKEIERSSKLCELHLAVHLRSLHDFEEQFEYKDLFDIAIQILPAKDARLILQRLRGDSLREIAKTNKITLFAMKQRHARTCRTIRRNIPYFEN